MARVRKEVKATTKKVAPKTLKAPAKTVKKSTGKKPVVPAKSVKKQAGKKPAAPAKKVPVKDEGQETVDYESMKVADIKALLEEKGLDTKGLKSALIARLKSSEKVSKPKTEEDEQVDEPAPKPKAPAKGAAKAKPPPKKETAKPKAPAKGAAKAKPPPKKETAKPKAPAKGAAKPKAPAKKDIEEEFPEKDIPTVVYCIDAKKLSTIIRKSASTSGGLANKSFFEDLFVQLKDYEEEEGSEENEEEEGSEEKEEEGSEEKEEEEGEEEEGSEEKEEEEGSEEKEEEEGSEEKEEEKPKMAVTYDEELGAFIDPSKKYLIDPNTHAVYARVIEEKGKKVPKMLRKADLPSLQRFRIYSDKTGPLVARKESDFLSALDALIKQSKEFHEGLVEEKVKPKMEEEPEEEGEEEGDDDGKEVELKSEEKEGDVDEELKEGEEDVLEKVSREEKEVLVQTPDIDEETFEKFLKAQHSGDVNRSDYIAISKKAGINTSEGEQIMLRYQYLSDKYPQVVASAKAKKAVLPKTSLLEKQEKGPTSLPQRRLIKKK